MTWLSIMQPHPMGLNTLNWPLKPKMVKLNGVEISDSKLLKSDTYMVRYLGNGDYSIIIKRNKQGEVKNHKVKLFFEFIKINCGFN